VPAGGNCTTPECCAYLPSLSVAALWEEFAGGIVGIEVVAETRSQTSVEALAVVGSFGRKGSSAVEYWVVQLGC